VTEPETRKFVAALQMSLDGYVQGPELEPTAWGCPIAS